MKKISILFILFICIASQLQAQTYCGDISYSIQLEALSYANSDNLLDPTAEAGIFELTAINPLNGATQEDKSCHYEEIPDEQSSPLTTVNINFATFAFGVEGAGCATLPDNFTINYGLNEDDGLFSDCDDDPGDDDRCTSSFVMSILSLNGSTGSVTQTVTCGPWTLRFTITATTFTPIAGDYCASPIKICTDANLTFNAKITGLSEGGNNYGCLLTQPRPTWFYLETGVTGNIDMSLVATNDVDFAIWGPYADLATATAACGALPAPVDCSYSTSATESINIPTSTVGQVWLLLVTNYAGTVQTFTLSKTGGTGDTDCSGVACPAGEVTVDFDPAVDCNADETLTFHLTITNPGDYTGPFTVQFAATGSGSGPVGLAADPATLNGPIIDIIATDPNPATSDPAYPGNFPGSDDATTAIGNVRIFDANGCEVTGLNGFTSWDLGYDKLFDCPAPLTNDICADAIPITCGITNGSNVGAQADTNTGCSNLGTVNFQSGVWYSISGVSGTITASTCNNTDFDSELVVYYGNCGSLTCIEGHDGDTCGTLDESITFTAISAATYYIYVTGHSGATGNFELSLDCCAADNGSWN